MVAFYHYFSKMKVLAVEGKRVGKVPSCLMTSVTSFPRLPHHGHGQSAPFPPRVEENVSGLQLQLEGCRSPPPTSSESKLMAALLNCRIPKQVDGLS